MADAVEKAKEAMKKQPEERSLEEQQAVVRAQNETEQANVKAEQALEEMKEALAEAPTRAEAEEMQAAAEALADFKNQNLERVAEQVEEMAKGEMEEPKDGHQKPQHLAWEAANRAEVLKKAMNQIAAEDEMATTRLPVDDGTTHRVTVEGGDHATHTRGAERIVHINRQRQVVLAHPRLMDEDWGDEGERFGHGTAGVSESSGAPLALRLHLAMRRWYRLAVTRPLMD